MNSAPKPRPTMATRIFLSDGMVKSSSRMFERRKSSKCVQNNGSTYETQAPRTKKKEPAALLRGLFNSAETWKFCQRTSELLVQPPASRIGAPGDQSKASGPAIHENRGEGVAKAVRVKADAELIGPDKRPANHHDADDRQDRDAPLLDNASPARVQDQGIPAHTNKR